MTWVKIEHRISGVKSKNCGLSFKALYRHGNAISKPSLLVSIRSALAIQFDWRPMEPIGLSFGEDEHAALMRLVRGQTPAIANVRIVRGKSMVLSFGHIPRFGEQPRPLTHTDGIKIDDNTIEIVIPAAFMNAAEEYYPPAKGPKPGTSKQAPTTPAPVDVPVVDGDAITYMGKTVEILTAAQSKLLSYLTSSYPATVDKVACWIALWGPNYPSTAYQIVSGHRTDAQSIAG